MLSTDYMNMQPFVSNMSEIEKLLKAKKEQLQSLQLSRGSSFQKTGQTAKEAIALIAESTAWAEDQANKFADVDRINEVLDFVRKEKSTLVKYSEGMLQASIEELYSNAADLAIVLNDVTTLATSIKKRSQKTLNYLNKVAKMSNLDD